MEVWSSVGSREGRTGRTEVPRASTTGTRQHSTSSPISGRGRSGSRIESALSAWLARREGWEGKQAGAELGLACACVGQGEQDYQGGDAGKEEGVRRAQVGQVLHGCQGPWPRAGGSREGRVAACWCGALHSKR